VLRLVNSNKLTLRSNQLISSAIGDLSPLARDFVASLASAAGH
jgi:hypothetical protein